MDKIFDIASRISTPLALAGLISTAVFFILKVLIQKDIFPIQTKKSSATLFKVIIERMFTLAIVALVLGFAGFVIVSLKQGDNHLPSPLPSSSPIKIVTPSLPQSTPPISPKALSTGGTDGASVMNSPGLLKANSTPLSTPNSEPSLSPSISKTASQSTGTQIVRCKELFERSKRAVSSETAAELLKKAITPCAEAKKLQPNDPFWAEYDDDVNVKSLSQKKSN